MLMRLILNLFRLHDAQDRKQSLRQRTRDELTASRAAAQERGGGQNFLLQRDLQAAEEEERRQQRR